MTRQRLFAVATICAGAAMILNALLGPLGVGMIRFHESAAMETQLLGGELTSLVLAGPIAILAGALWWRGARIAPALAFAPLGYAVYTYVQLVLVPDYARYPGNNERWFPLYVSMVMTAWIVAVAAWRELDAHPLSAPGRTIRHVFGTVLVVTNGLFALAWVASIASTYVQAPSPEYREHPTAFWLIRLMDLGFVIPIGIVTGVGLLRGTASSQRLAFTFAGAQTLLACAVAMMAVRIALSGADAMSWVVAAPLSAVAASLLGLYISLIVSASRNAARAGASTDAGAHVGCVESRNAEN
jgi:hypothetical protein